MRMSTAYFAGAGTVVIAVAVGLGGGLLIAEMMSPRTPTDTAKLERRTVPQPAPMLVSAAPSPAASPVTSASTSAYLAATQAAATGPVIVKPAGDTQSSSQAISEKSQQQPQPSPVTTTASAEPASMPAQAQQAGTPDASFAKASDADVKKASDADGKSTEGKSRNTDSRRAERERRRAERHQQWAERRRPRRDQDARPDMRDVEQAVREDSEPRAYLVERTGQATPRFNLFDEND
jgi:hypothetical protein